MKETITMHTHTVDLSGLKTEMEVFEKFGEVFEFGGPDGNFSLVGKPGEKGWGYNWDAFRDCLRYLDVGGIWLTSRKFEYPLEIKIVNVQEFEKGCNGGFQIMQDIFEKEQKEQAKEGKNLVVTYD